jgi:hypothetical protein
MAREYLRECYTASQIELQFARMRLAAERLAASERGKIETVAAALLQHGCLSGDQIVELIASKQTPLTGLFASSAGK